MAKEPPKMSIRKIERWKGQIQYEIVRLRKPSTAAAISRSVPQGGSGPKPIK